MCQGCKKMEHEIELLKEQMAMVLSCREIEKQLREILASRIDVVSGSLGEAWSRIGELYKAKAGDDGR